MKDLIQCLEERGFIEDMTGEEVRDHLKKPRRIYCGFDPTSDSLHLGNMIALMGLSWFQRFGHIPIAVMGGATGMVGDPSGKHHERPLLEEGCIQRNLSGIHRDIETFLSTSPDQSNAVKVLNNYDWFKNISLIDFLRDVGKHFRMGTMLSRESVRARLESEEGLSFTEFSYQLLQGYDFLHLYDLDRISVQVGGSDQWGNILSGTELVRKMRGGDVFGLTFPLLTTSDGKKFGKSEKGAIWLSPEKLSPYEFYQYLVRTSDQDVIHLLKMLTFMEMEEIHHYETMMQNQEYVPNTVQKRLAEEVTRLVHGEDGLSKALRVTSAAKPGAVTDLDVQTLESISEDMPSCTLALGDIIGSKLIDLLVRVQLQGSKGSARRMIRNGGIYMNNMKVQDEDVSVKESDLVEGRFLLLAAGRKNKVLVRVEC